MSQPLTSIEQVSPAVGRPAVGPVRVADALGWGSTLLGTTMIVAPRRVLDTIGIRAKPQNVRWTMAVGVRELLAMTNIVTMRRRRIGMWSRVFGDAMDLALLSRAHRRRRNDRARIRATAGVVGGLMALDLVTAMSLGRAEGTTVPDGALSTGTGAFHDTGGGPTRLRTAITIRRPIDDVRVAYMQFDWSCFAPQELLATGDVRIVAAPGDRGTEVHVDHEPRARAGALGASAARLVGRSPDQVIADELRRFKSLLETGVVVRSETSPEGPSSTRQLFHKTRPARPVGKES
jgi:hypothetical protein